MEKCTHKDTSWRQGTAFLSLVLILPLPYSPKLCRRSRIIPIDRDKKTGWSGSWGPEWVVNPEWELRGTNKNKKYECTWSNGEPSRYGDGHSDGNWQCYFPNRQQFGGPNSGWQSIPNSYTMGEQNFGGRRMDYGQAALILVNASITTHSSWFQH